MREYTIRLVGVYRDYLKNVGKKSFFDSGIDMEVSRV